MLGSDKLTRPSRWLYQSLQNFINTEVSGGILLLAATALALTIANSPWAEAYFHFWETDLTFSIGRFEISKSLSHWINDGLMSLFFFIVGLEIKREMIVGQLATLRKAALPGVAAAGGMVAPALIYVFFNPTGIQSRGWGIPMATDIAFSLGILALLGKRVPFQLKVFLAAFAIADDIGAVIVIAVFYTAKISILALAIGMACFGVLIVMNRLRVYTLAFYVLFSLLMWFAFLKSGVHATVAGVLAAVCMPASSKFSREKFVNDTRLLLQEFEQSEPPKNEGFATGEQHAILTALEDRCEGVQAKLHVLEHNLHPWVTYLVIPVFALANAGVSLNPSAIDKTQLPVFYGIAFGLFLGKQFGIFLFTWLAMKLRLVSLPDGVTLSQIYGVAILGGIGFTMSLFVSQLAFDQTEFLSIAKLAIIAGSAISAVVGLVVISLVTRRSKPS